MKFNHNDFSNLLNFYKIQDNFPDNAKKCFEKISEVSKSNKGRSLINDDKYVFNLDNMCYNSYLKDNCSPKDNPSCVDALYFKKNKLYLIEFKGTSMFTLDLKVIIDECIKKIKNDDELVSNLEFIKKRYDDEIICKLKIKPSDALFLALPQIYKYYCEKENIKYDNSEFFSWLLDVPKKLYFVFSDNTFNSEKNKSKGYKHNMRHKLEKRCSFFKALAKMECLIITATIFKNDFLKEIY